MKLPLNNYEIIFIAIAGLFLYQATLHAGTVISDPSADSANILIIAQDDTVIFTAESSGNDDYVDIGNSTFQNGTATFGRGEGTGTATVTFTSAAAGQSGGNKCKILVNSEGSDGETCSTDKEIDFEVDVPLIKVVSGTLSMNQSNEYIWTINRYVEGITNLSEVQIYQQLCTDTLQYDYSGNATYPGGDFNNTNGAWVGDPPGSAPFTPEY